MRDEEGRFFCDQCGRRSARGGIQAHTVGNDFTTRRLRTGPAVLYCSEACLKDALFGLEPGDDPVEVLARRVRGLERALKEARSEARLDVDRAEAEAARCAEILGHLRGLVSSIDSEGLVEAVAPGTAGDRLALLLRNLVNVSDAAKKR